MAASLDGMAKHAMVFHLHWAATVRFYRPVSVVQKMDASVDLVWAQVYP